MKRSVLFYLTFPLFLCSIGILFVASRVTAFADRFNEGPSAAVRKFLATLTAKVPFSIAEIIVLLIPIWGILLIYGAVRAAKSDRGKRYFTRVLSLLFLFVILFTATFGTGYYATPLAEKLGLDREKISAEDLHATACALAEEINALVSGVTFEEDGFSVMPYGLDTLSEILCDAYEDLAREETFLDTFESRIKPIATSKVFMRTHISGVYAFFTGESNLTASLPDYVLPQTTAHEFAHQRGISREDEASFVAFLIARHTDDVYLRYSILAETYTYVSNALYSASRELWQDAYGRLAPEVRAEYRAFSAFFETIENTTASKVAEKTNDTYLHIAGSPEGVRSYDLVTDLCVAYYRAQASEN